MTDPYSAAIQSPGYAMIQFRILVFAIGVLALPAQALAELVFADGFEGALAPMPLISRGKPVAASGGNAGALVDGVYYGLSTWDVTPTAQNPAWIAIHVGTGAARAMLSFIPYPSSNPPGSYRIETSANSSNGSDGSWTVAVSVSNNSVASRAHTFDFAGKQWLRLVVLDGSTAGAPISLNEIDVHDASASNRDSWMFVGDSITGGAFSRAYGVDNFPERIHGMLPAYFPLMIGAGVGGSNAGDGAAHISEWLATNPDIQHWVISYGTNDSATGDPQYSPQFRNNMRTIITLLQAAGKTVMIPRIPYKTGGETYLPAYNAVVDDLQIEFHLQPGPDLYAYFLAHPEQLYDGVHPNDIGNRAMNQLWANAVRSLYP